MYKASEQFNKAITAANRSIKARLIDAKSEEVLSDAIKSFTITSGSEEIAVGSAIASYIQVTAEKQDISLSGKEARLEIGLELEKGIEYIPMGVYMIQNPKTESNKLSFTAYDCIANKCNKAYFSKLEYPVDALDVLSEISTLSGVEIDTSKLARGIQINKRAVADDEGEESAITTYVNPFDGYTYKEAIGFIAGLFGKIAVAGRTGEVEFRWYSDNGYTIKSDTFYNDLQETEETFVLEKITCDTVDKTIISGAGATGIDIQNPVMTQAILDNIYNKIKGLAYTPTLLRFIGDVRIDICDIVTVIKNDDAAISLPITSLQTSYDGGLMQTVGSYGNTLEEDETDTKGPITEMVERTYQELAFVKTMMVDNVYGSFLSFKKGEFDSLFTNDIKAAEGTFTNYLTGVNILANNITAGTLSVERLIVAGSDKSIVYEINKANGTISESTIDGSSITERTITADRIVADSITSKEINVKDLFAQNITATGTISGLTLYGATGVFTGEIRATKGVLKNCTFQNGDDELGIDIYVYNNEEWRIRSATTELYAYFAPSGIKITSKGYFVYAGLSEEGLIENGKLISEIYAAKSHEHWYLKSGNYRVGVGSNTARFATYSSDGTSGADKLLSLGSANTLWTRVYAANATISTSDKRLKTDINDLEERYEKMFDLLHPITYRWKGEGHDRIHTGFISQEVKNAMDETGLSPLEFGAYCYDDFADDPEWNKDSTDGMTDRYSLAYEEFIALNTHMIQKTMNELEQVKKELSEMKKIIRDLKGEEG